MEGGGDESVLLLLLSIQCRNNKRFAIYSMHAMGGTDHRRAHSWHGHGIVGYYYYYYY
jgi:hypothetical protein